VVPILHHWEDDGHHWLLIRRSLTDPNEKAYSFVFAPKATTLPEMVAAIGAGFHIEEDFENAKDLGLDHDEVRCFVGGYRYITLVLVALAFLTGICATERFSPCSISASRSPCRACASPSQKCAISLHGSSDPLHHLPVGFWPGRGGVAPIKVVPAMTTSNVVWRLADPGWPSPLCSRFCSLSYFPDIQEISWKCWSSWKTVSSCLPLPSSRKEF
jgi:hypothetical protein